MQCKVEMRFKGRKWSAPKEANKPFFVGIKVGITEQGGSMQLL